jgi:hypothetical protein
MMVRRAGSDPDIEKAGLGAGLAAERASVASMAANWRFNSSSEMRREPDLKASRSFFFLD